ncbi:MAG: hypothetical protein WCH44_18970 [Betaproteobacteria bacterium]
MPHRLPNIAPPTVTARATSTRTQFDVFVRQRVYPSYAREPVPDEQVDAVNPQEWLA